MKKIKIIGLLIVTIVLLNSCVSMLTKPPKPFKDIPAASSGVAFITLSEEMQVTHVNGRRSSMSSSTKRHQIAAGHHELTVSYRTVTYDATGKQRRVRATGIKLSRMFEEGKSYVILNEVEGYYSQRVRVVIVENTEQSLIQIPLPKYKPSTIAIVPIAFSPNGSQFIVTKDNLLYLHNTIDGKLINTIKHSSKIIGVLWSPDSSRFITVEERRIRIWEAASSNETRSISIPRTRFAMMLHITPDGSKLVGNSGNTLKVWDINSGAELVSIDRLYQTFGIAFISLSSDGQYFAAAFNDNTTRVYSINGGTPIFSIGERRLTYIPIEFLDNNTLIALLREGGILRQPKYVSINISANQVTELESEHVPSMNYSNDGSKIISLKLSNGRSYIEEVNAVTGEVINRYTSPNADISSLVLSPAENKFATFSFIDGKIRIWEYQTDGTLTEIPIVEVLETEEEDN